MLLQGSKLGTMDDWSTLLQGSRLETKDNLRLHATLGPKLGTKCDSATSELHTLVTNDEWCTQTTSEFKIRD